MDFFFVFFPLVLTNYQEFGIIEETWKNSHHSGFEKKKVGGVNYWLQHFDQLSQLFINLNSVSLFPVNSGL